MHRARVDAPKPSFRLPGRLPIGVLAATLPVQATDLALLNVSDDPTRELYQDYNKAFAAYWKSKTSGGARWNYLAAWGFAKKKHGSDAKAPKYAQALMARKELGPGKFDIVAPQLSILAEPPVAVADKVVDKKGTRAVAPAYLEYLYTPEGQKIAAEICYRPIDAKVAAQFASQSPKLELFKLDSVFGSWREAQKTHFADGGTFDKVVLKR